MRIRHYSKGKFYLIECPDGTRVVRCAAQSAPDTADSHDLLVVPFRGQELTIPADPPELLPLLAESRTIRSLAGWRAGARREPGGRCLPELQRGRRELAVSRGRLEHRSLRQLRLRVRTRCGGKGAATSFVTQGARKRQFSSFFPPMYCPSAGPPFDQTESQSNSEAGHTVGQTYFQVISDVPDSSHSSPGPINCLRKVQVTVHTGPTWAERTGAFRTFPGTPRRKCSVRSLTG